MNSATSGQARDEAGWPAGAARPAHRRLRRAALVGSAVLALLALGTIALWYATPPVNDLQARVTRMAALHGGVVLAPAAVPPLLARAIVATEDERFYQHHGIDVVGLTRAFLYDAGHLCGCQGGSTITQQLVKQLYLGGSDGGLDKLADMALALKAELNLDKGQILADYLSIVATGYGRWGMAAAANAYFHRPLAALDLGQLALLAGLPQAPTAYDPLLHPEAAEDRRREVLSSMVADGYITAAQAAAAAKEPVTAGATAPTR